MKDNRYMEKDFWGIDNQIEKYEDVESILEYGGHVKDALLTIVMPVYQRIEYFEEALMSAVNQTTDYSYEIIVIDNASETNAFFEIIKRMKSKKILYYRNKNNIGMFGNWNRCVDLVKTEWLLMLHDDDVLHTDYVNEIMNIISSCRNVSFIGCLHNDIDKQSAIIRTPISDRKIHRVRMYDMYFSIPYVSIIGLAFRKDSAYDVGGFDEYFFPGSDVNFICKLVRNHGGVIYNKTLVNYRIADNESLKTSTVVSFITYNYIQLNAIYKELLFIPRFFHNIHQSVMAIEAEVGANDVWKLNVNFDDVNKNCNISKPNNIVLFMYKIIRKIIRSIKF